MKLLLINSTNTARSEFVKMKAKTAGRAKSVPSLSGFIEPRR